MLFEDLIMLLALGSGVFLIGIPFYKLLRAVVPQKRDPVAEAKIRLEAAKADAEAAKLNKQTEKLYDDLYKDVIEDDEIKQPENRRRVDE
jgi:hypothetical protein